MDSGKHVRRFENFLEQLNNGRLDSIQQNLSNNFYGYRPKEGEKNAGEVYYEILSDLKGAFSNLRFSVPNLEITGEEIKGKLTISGTQDGMLWGAPVSGKQVLWDVDIVVRIEQDRFAVALENIAMPEVMGIYASDRPGPTTRRYGQTLEVSCLPPRGSIEGHFHWSDCR